MLPEIGASELLVIAIVALIVVGPKDLPVLLRRFGQFMAKVRGMANEFRASFDEMARQSELDDLRKEVEAMRRGQFADMSISDSSYRDTVSDIENSLSDVGVQMHPPMSYQYAQTSEPPEPLEAPAAEPAKPARKPRAAKPKAAAASTPKAKAVAAAKPKPRTPKSAAKKIVE
jgi:sec-independent protein translocase protein TatB